MKTLFNSLKTSSVVAIALVASLFSLNATAATVNWDKGNPDAEIKKVVVTGNANVLLVQSTSQSVKMDEFDLEKVAVKQVGHTLTISSNENQPVNITVYVNDIYRIDASDKATVKTIGNFDVSNLQIMLKDNANARIKTNTKSIYTVVSDKANLKLIGTSAHHINQSSLLAKVDTNKFAANQTQQMTAATVNAPAIAKRTAGLSK